MIPAMIASVLILYWYWRENQPKPGEPEPGSAEALRRELADLNARLDGIRDRLARS
ncbi:hypothetical protein [Bradyrhizobium sp. CCGUVB14]|uniref:hypothetical protein n=1 Tax=Bradyrhizobium sp. CCGUVB14 TaxID=2949628 RepID=UPI0020B21D50|nr:hypothetical protein [Bradyrhizobium sp. CCGUVB14]MCP3440643.1 hypothetical protein [Bradyrhizobium sp. CCGUVB14]